MSERPLSPHLQVFRWPLSMALSILHRVTGAALAVGTLMVIWMLLSAASGEDSWNQFQSFAASWPGQVMLFGWSASLFFHLCNGIRHLVWDAGLGYDLKSAFASGCIVLFATAILTFGVWASILF